MHSQCQNPIANTVNPCFFFCVSELKNKLEATLKEKNQAVTNLEALQDQLRLSREEVSLMF